MGRNGNGGERGTIKRCGERKDNKGSVRRLASKAGIDLLQLDCGGEEFTDGGGDVIDGAELGQKGGELRELRVGGRAIVNGDGNEIVRSEGKGLDRGFDEDDIGRGTIGIQEVKAADTVCDIGEDTELIMKRVSEIPRVLLYAFENRMQIVFAEGRVDHQLVQSAHIFQEIEEKRSVVQR